MNKSAVFLLTHFIDANILGMFERLRKESSDRYDIFLALNCNERPLSVPAEGAALGSALFVFNNATLMGMGYPEKCRPEGWNAMEQLDSIALAFFREHSEYAYYWCVEYDVHYEGRWGFLFERFESSRADLLCTMLDTAEKARFKLDLLSPAFTRPNGSKVTSEEAIIGFFPFYRLSNRMLRMLDRCFAEGWNGNYEFTWGTLAKEHGFEMEEIGGNGPWVRPHNRNVFYFNTVSRWDISPGTFVFRPTFTRVRKRENTLWHPVKPQGKYFIYSPVGPDRSLKGWIKHFTKAVLYSTAIWFWFTFKWRPATASPVGMVETRNLAAESDAA
jgi:hypothetical protein